MKKKSRNDLAILSVIALFAVFIIWNPYGKSNANTTSTQSLPAIPFIGGGANVCSQTSGQTGYLIANDGNQAEACNTRTGTVEYTNADPALVLSYAVNHLDSGRTSPQNIVLNGNFFNVGSKVSLVSNVHITFNGIYKITNNGFSGNSIIGENNPAIQKKNIIIDGTGMLDCGSQPSSVVVSGIFISNLDTFTISDLKIQHCPHVGLYLKGAANGKVQGVSSHDNVGVTGVGTNFAFFGGHNNNFDNLVSYGACGPLGHGFQIEANDDAVGDYFSNNVMTRLVAHNNCGDNFIASNVAGTNTISDSTFYNAGQYNIYTDSGSGIVFIRDDIHDASQSQTKTYENIYMGSYLSKIQSSHIYDTVGLSTASKGGILFANTSAGTDSIADNNRFENLSTGIDVAGKNISITNNCYYNVSTFLMVETGATLKANSNNNPC